MERTAKDIFRDVETMRASGADEKTLNPLYWEAALTLKGYIYRYFGPRYKNDPASFDDAVQNALLEVFKVARTFDSKFGDSFFIYAKKSLVRAREKTMRIGVSVPMPYNLKLVENKCHKVSNDHYKRHGTRLSTEELVERTGLPAHRVKEATVYARYTVSMQAPARGMDDVFVGDCVPSNYPYQDYLCQAKEEYERSQALPQTYRKVLTLRYGLDGSEPRTHLQVGAALGYSGEYVRKLEIDAMAKLGWLTKRSTTCRKSA